MLYDEHCDHHTSSLTSPLPGYTQILKMLELRKKQRTSGHLGTVTLRGKEPKVVPAGGKVPLEGHVSTSNVTAERCALVEHPTASALPGGIFVDTCLITLPSQHPSKLPVWVRNETEHDITLPANCVIAELSTPLDIISSPSLESKQPETVKCCQLSYQQPCLAETPDLKFDFGESPVPESWKNRVTHRLRQFSDVFAHHELDYGHATRVKHHLKLRDETPFKQRSRPIHPQDYEAVRKHLRTLLDAEIIRESESPFSSPIVVVRKNVRLCVDYRKLNNQTIKEAYALPNVEETFSALSGSQWFSVMDLKSGYYQIEMEETDKPKTAFVCPLGFYDFNRMPQGITNAPSTFQRLMEKCMGDINLKEVLVFIDDLIVFSKSLEEHETRLTHVLTRLRDNGLKLSPDKCRFFQTSVRYLGHVVSRDGVHTDPEKIRALTTWPVPKTLKELQSFLGFSGYYRRFVRDYSKIVKPLNALTTGYPPARKGHRSKTGVKYFHPKEPFADRWTPACQQAFETLIERLTTSPVLGFADQQLPYVLHKAQVSPQRELRTGYEECREGCCQKQKTL
ncbi:hypothetical protein AALO_G00116720 [Alosa alosa]|uniref:ribonuclease H n=1 Tax=Alosa alosa TaxID=278164 RepID=A0AAV6GU03_9TELE|nr:hypothetical protein AALO_G00116720 [Alosa alosa]